MRAPLFVLLAHRACTLTGLERLAAAANSLPAARPQGLRELFKSIDADGSGTITVEELRAALKNKGQLIPESDIQHLVRYCCCWVYTVQGDAGCGIHCRLMRIAAFRVALHSRLCIGRVTIPAAVGRHSPTCALQISSTDINGNGTIDYEEFLAATIHQSKLEQEENLYKAFQVTCWGLSCCGQCMSVCSC